MSNKVFLVGEDAVTQAIAKRLLQEKASKLEPGITHPVRGGQIIQQFPKYLKLAVTQPVFLLTDLDAESCPVMMKEKWLAGAPEPDQLIFRICVDEAEGWLMSDREGFANYLSVDPSLIPEATALSVRESENREIRLPYKPSLFLMRELAAKSTDSRIRQMLQPRHFAKKGPAYNSALLPFIHQEWNIEQAAKNSHSLQRAIKHIQRIDQL